MKKRVLVSDVDNTLFDWVDIWYRSFSAMLQKTSEISGLSAESLYPSIGRIHRKYRTSEYAFVLEEIPELVSLYGTGIQRALQPAIDAYREARAEALHLYPGVEETLKALSSAGVTLIAYTESMAFYTNYRFRKLGLDRLFDFLYSPPDHDVPKADRAELRAYPPEHYALARTVHRHTPEGELKPNPDILASILREVGATPAEAVYVGDSLMKVIAMAQEAGLYDVYAAYGIAQNKPEYGLLRKVTHWSPEDVAREKLIASAPNIVPSMILKTDIRPITTLF